MKPAKRLVFTRDRDVTNLRIEPFRLLWLDLNHLAENRYSMCRQKALGSYQASHKAVVST